MTQVKGATVHAPRVRGRKVKGATVARLEYPKKKRRG